MAISNNKIQFNLEARDKASVALRRESANAEKMNKRVTSNFRTMANNMKDSFRGIERTMFRLFSIAAIFRFGQSLLRLGGKSIETANLFAVSFGSMTEDMDDFGKKLQEVAGISDNMFRDQAAKINNLAVTLGVGQREAMLITQDLMSRGLDIGSLFNVDRDRVFDQIRSGMVGMIKPLRPYGINLEVAQVNQYAWANGIAETNKELTQQQKLLTRYLIIMESTLKAEGDLERTIDTVANAQRRLNDLWEQFVSVGGRGVTPVLAAILKVLIPLVTVMTKVIQSLVNFVGWMGRMRESSTIFFIVTEALKIFTAALFIATIGVIINLSAMGAWIASIYGTVKALISLAFAQIKAFWWAFLLAGVILVLVALLKRWAGDTSKAGSTLEKSGLQAKDFADGLGGINDGLDAMRSKMRFLTPLDEIVNIPDSKGGNLDAGLTFDMPNFDDLGSSIDDLTAGLLDGEGILKWIQERLSDSWELTKLIGNEIKGWVSDRVDGIKQRFEDSWELTKMIGNEIKNWVLDRVDGLKQRFEDSWELTKMIGKYLWDLVPAPVKGFLSWLTNPIKKALDDLKEINDELKSTGKSPREHHREYRESAGGGLKWIPKTFKDTWDIFTGGFGGGRADGGPVTPSKFNIVGERGPELFIPDTRGTVVSNETIRATQGNAGVDTGAIAQAIQSLADRPQNLYIDSRKVAQATYKANEQEGSRNGRQPITRSVG